MMILEWQLVGEGAVWTTQELWPLLLRTVRTVLLVLVSFRCWTLSENDHFPGIQVVGFLNATFSGVEQGPGHVVPVGYLKGGTVAQQNLEFDVKSIPGTASESYCDAAVSGLS